MSCQTFVAVLVLACTLSFLISPSESAQSITNKRERLKHGGKKNNQVCQNEQCRLVAKLMKQNLNESVEPCDDFYAYACGNKQQQIRKLTQVHSKGLQKHISTKADAFLEILADQPHRGDLKSLVLEREMYINCMDLGHRSHYNKLEFISLLNTTGGLKLFTPNVGFGFRKTWQDADLIYSNLGFGQAFFEVKVTPVSDNSEENIISLLPPSRDRKRLEEIDQLVNSIDFKLDVVNVVQDILKMEQSRNENSFFVKPDSYEKVVEFIKAFEKIISEGWNDEIEPGNNKISLGTWQTYYNQAHRKADSAKIDWRQTLNNLFNLIKIEIDESEEINIERKQYFFRLARLLQDTDPLIIASYVHLRFISQGVKYTDVHLAPIKYGSRTEDCVLQSSDLVGVSHVYVNKYFQEENRAEALAMNDGIKRYLTAKLFETWMDQNTKPIVKQKLDKFKVTMGYADWVNDLEFVDNYYGDLQLGSTYFGNMMNYTQFKMKQNLIELRNPSSYKNVSVSDLLVRLHWSKLTKNNIVFSVDYLREDSFSFFSPRLPRPVNYGAFGTEISSMWLNVMAPLDQQFNKHGKAVHGVDKKKCELQGVQKLISENMDLESTVQLSNYIYAAFVIYSEQANDTEIQKLPGLERFSNDQLFFMSLANDMCNSGLYNVTEAPTRLNTIVSYMHQFTKSFQCPKQSPMNKSTKCIS